jgi:tetratricopeptide (TPR) repeat protein
LNGEALSRLAEHFDAFISEKKDLGLAGYALLDSQLDHILAVQSACNNAGQWDMVRRLTWALDGYLGLQGHWAERRKSAEVGLLAARSSKDRYDEGSFLILLGLAYAALGEARNAIEYHEQALAIAREIGDKRGEGADLGNLGNDCADLGEARKAIECYEQRLVIARDIGDKRGEAYGCWNLGLEYEKEGDLELAVDLMRICVEFERNLRPSRC